MHLRCVRCGETHPPELLYACARCGGILEVAEPIGTPVGDDPYRNAGMWRHASRLSVGDASAIVSLREGNTPLHRADRLADALDFTGVLWIKDETVNPSGSFKDRLISAAISKAKELGAPGVLCASSGNAGASTAVYAARAGMVARILVPERTPAGKLGQIRAHGATLELVPGHYSNSYARGLALAAETGFANLTTTYLNPYGVDALKLVGQEILDALGEPPTHVLIPTGSGPLVKGVLQGFREAGQAAVPVAVQAEGCAPIVAAYEAGAAAVTPWGEPTTFASGISDPLIGYAGDGTHTLELLRQSGGIAIAVSDTAIRDAMTLLARSTGLLAEPTGASPIAALAALLRDGRISRDARVVCLVTGHGFKDPGAWQAVTIG